MPFALPAAPLITDGGLATDLEAHGHDLSDDLWSARLLHDDPDAIRAVHRRFFDAGADFATTASYQASYAGFARRGGVHRVRGGRVRFADRGGEPDHRDTVRAAVVRSVHAAR